MNNKSESRLESFLESPSKSLWTLAIPIMFGMGVHTLYNLVDMFFIGKLGGEEITAIAFNMPIFFLMLGLTMGLGSGVTASIARYIGQKNKILNELGVDFIVTQKFNKMFSKIKSLWFQTVWCFLGFFFSKIFFFEKMFFEKKNYKILNLKNNFFFNFSTTDFIFYVVLFQT